MSGSDAAPPGTAGTAPVVIDPSRFDAVIFTAGVVRGPDAVVRPLLRALRRRGVRTAVVSTAPGLAVDLALAGLDELVDVQVDTVGPLRARRDPGALDLCSEALRLLSAPPARIALLGDDARVLRRAGALGLGMVVPMGTETPGPRRALPGAPPGDALAAVVVGPLTGNGRQPAGEADRWWLHFGGLDLADEPRREALCTVGNGYLASRGAAPEHGAAGGHYPGTYLAGIYNRLVTEVTGTALEHEELVNVPNWLPFTFRLGDGSPWFGEAGWDAIDHDQWLDMRHAILHRTTRVRDGEGHVVRVAQRRLASMADPHVLALETTLVAENWSGELEIRSAIDGDVRNAGVPAYRGLADRHLSVVRTDTADDGIDVLVAETVQSRARIAVAARCRCRPARAVLHDDHHPAARRIDHELVVHVSRGEPVVVEKVAGVHTSRDPAISECALAATAAVARAGSFEQLAEAHREAWSRLWSRWDVWVDAHGRMPTVVVLHLLHLLQSVSPHTGELDAGIPARGLHGEAYRGHVFWDELFVFPLLNFRFPALSRSLLRYRHRRLPEARRLAATAGYRGAMFPWQSGTSGREETPSQYFNPLSGHWIPDHSHLQRHVSLAIAHNVWSYFQVTGDLDAMVEFGGELMIEIARFWASAAHYDAVTDRFDITGVMGPDEFHDGPLEHPGAGLTNNAYTNVMAAWTLWRARQLVQRLDGRGGRRLFERLDLRPEELDEWEEVGTKLRIPFDRSGRIAQFDGYEDLEELNGARQRARYGEGGRLDLVLEAAGDTPNRYKMTKQADVLMLFFMLTAEELVEVLDRLGYDFDPASIPETVDYYLARTSNGSTLSRVVNAWVLARTDRRASWRLLLDALSSDIDDIQGGTTGEGIHLGAMAGTIDLLQRCYVDLDARDDVLHVNPRLPRGLPRLRFAVTYRGHRLDLDVRHSSVRIRARPGTAPPVQVSVREQQFSLGGGEWREVTIDGQ